MALRAARVLPAAVTGPRERAPLVREAADWAGPGLAGMSGLRRTYSMLYLLVVEQGQGLQSCIMPPVALIRLRVSMCGRGGCSALRYAASLLTLRT